MVQFVLEESRAYPMITCQITRYHRTQILKKKLQENISLWFNCDFTVMGIPLNIWTQT